MTDDAESLSRSWLQAVSGAMTNSAIWPERLAERDAVRAWIAGVLPGQPHVIGPLDIMQAKEWGVTARFAWEAGEARAAGREAAALARSPAALARSPAALARSPAALARSPVEQGVIFKASTLPLFAGSGQVYALLDRRCPGVTPALLAWRETSSGVWSLFRPFSGVIVEALGELEPLLDTARTLARIQVAVAGAPADELARLPRSRLADLPAAFAEVEREVAERLAPFWRTEGRELAEQFALPDDLPERLRAVRPALTRWVSALGAWPESLDHVDLHGENAIRQPDGRILIFDWEEANLSCPFFSLDRLLDDARALDGEDAPSASGDALPTPSERLLRDAYLDALPWGTRADRERALDLALCLAPIKTASEALRLAEALGWEEGSPDVTAWALGRALPRWARMRQSA